MADTVMLHLRLNKGLVKEIDSVVEKEHYNSRTEFFGEAARKRIEEKRKIAIALREVQKHYGEGKRLGIKLPSEGEMEKIRQNVWKELHSD